MLLVIKIENDQENKKDNKREKLDSYMGQTGHLIQHRHKKIDSSKRGIFTKKLFDLFLLVLICLFHDGIYHMGTAKKDKKNKLSCFLLLGFFFVGRLKVLRSVQQTKSLFPILILSFLLFFLYVLFWDKQ